MSSCSCCPLPSTGGRVRWCGPRPHCFLPAFPRLVPDALWEQARGKTSGNSWRNFLSRGCRLINNTPSPSTRLRSELEVPDASLWEKATAGQRGLDGMVALSRVPLREEALWPHYPQSYKLLGVRSFSTRLSPARVTFARILLPRRVGAITRSAFRLQLTAICTSGVK